MPVKEEESGVTISLVSSSLLQR